MVMQTMASTCVSKMVAHSIRRIGEWMRVLNAGRCFAIEPNSYSTPLVPDFHIYVMVDGVCGDVVCDQNTLHGHSLSEKSTCTEGIIENVYACVSFFPSNNARISFNYFECDDCLWWAKLRFKPLSSVSLIFETSRGTMKIYF